MVPVAENYYSLCSIFSKNLHIHRMAWIGRDQKDHQAPPRWPSCIRGPGTRHSTPDGVKKKQIFF